MNIKFIMGFAVSLALSLAQPPIAWAAIKNTSAAVKPVKPIVIAIIDTGTDIQHPELRNYIWTNPGETGKDQFGLDKETNGIDDDDNGFVDDVHGWNFVDHSNRVDDQNGHGTHVAGIIKNEFERLMPTDSNRTALAPVRLMILKYFDAKGKIEDSIRFSVQAIQYANKMNVDIINYSGGGDDSSISELYAIRRSKSLGILFVAAAGNGQTNTNFKKYYPASYALDNMISVGAITAEGDYASFSNYGNLSVDIAAPGNAINSTLPNKKHGLMSGTSQATAYVTGAAAKLMSVQREKLIPEQIIALLLKNSRNNKTLVGKTKYQLALVNN